MIPWVPKSHNYPVVTTQRCTTIKQPNKLLQNAMLVNAKTCFTLYVRSALVLMLRNWNFGWENSNHNNAVPIDAPSRVPIPLITASMISSLGSWFAAFDSHTIVLLISVESLLVASLIDFILAVSSFSYFQLGEAARHNSFLWSQSFRLIQLIRVSFRNEWFIPAISGGVSEIDGDHLLSICLNEVGTA